MQRLRVIVTLIFLVSLMIWTLAQEKTLAYITLLLDEAQMALRQEDLTTAQMPLMMAEALLTKTRTSECGALADAKVLLGQALYTSDAAEAQTMVRQARTLIEACSTTTLVAESRREGSRKIRGSHAELSDKADSSPIIANTTDDNANQTP